MKTSLLIPMYHAIKIAPITPKNNQFCRLGSNVFSNSLTTSLELRAPTAKTMKNSIANQVQNGHDSFGMCTLLCAPTIGYFQTRLFNFCKILEKRLFWVTDHGYDILSVFFSFIDSTICTRCHCCIVSYTSHLHTEVLCIRHYHYTLYSLGE